jgi:hypothetical protein
MQETPTVQTGVPDTPETALREHLNTAVIQTEALLQLLHTLQTGARLSLDTWQEVFAASQDAVERINQAVTLAQDVFDGHVVLLPGFVAAELTCDEFQCLTWQ